MQKEIKQAIIKIEQQADNPIWGEEIRIGLAMALKIIEKELDCNRQ